MYVCVCIYIYIDGLPVKKWFSIAKRLRFQGSGGLRADEFGHSHHCGMVKFAVATGG